MDELETLERELGRFVPSPCESLESILTTPDGFGLTSATPLQRAICRISDGFELRELAHHPDVRAAVGKCSHLAGARPTEMIVLAGIRGGKSLIAAGYIVRASQVCDVSGLGRGEVPRISIISIKRDLAVVVRNHLIGNILGSPKLKALLLEEPTANQPVLLRHPSGRPIEVDVVAGAGAGSSVISRWSAGCIFDEAPRMHGEETEAVINYSELRRAVLGRLLPGSQIWSIGSPYAPMGPIYELSRLRWKKASRDLVIVRAKASAMNPVWWTPERIAAYRKLPDGGMAYRTDVLAEFADPEAALLTRGELDAITRGGPRWLSPSPDASPMIAALQPATRSNVWTIVLVKSVRLENRRKRIVVGCREWRPTADAPLTPDAIFSDLAVLLKPYGVRGIWTDRASSRAKEAAARRHGLALYAHDLEASSYVFGALATRIAEGSVEIPPDEQLKADLLGIRRRVTPTGHVSIVFPATRDGRRADYAPTLAIAVAKSLADETPVPAPRTAAEIVREEVAASWRREEDRILAQRREEREAAIDLWGEEGRHIR